jgi:peptide/nickel transport system permease protein
MEPTGQPQPASQTAKMRRRPTLAAQLLQHVRETPLTGIGATIVTCVALCALLAGWLAPYDPAFQDYTVLAEPPSRAHWLGTDDLGRDVLSRVIYGSRVSLLVGLVAVSIALALGVHVGLVSGFFGGRVDNVLMRLVDGIKAFPGLILALAITAVLGPGIRNVMIAVGVVAMPAIARLTRGQILTVRELEFVTAARAQGASAVRIMARYIWPNVTSPIIVQSTLQIGTAITAEAALSFLGVGVQPPTPSWGEMLRSGSKFLESAPWLAFSPGAAIFLTVLAFNFVGDGIRKVLDPRLAKGGRA